MNGKFSQIVIGIIIFISSALISLYIVEKFLPERDIPRKNIAKNLYYPKNYNASFKNIEYEYDLVTNDQGIRYTNIPLQKNNDINRIFVLGDSYTEGIGVKNDETYSQRLEGYFRNAGNPISFINGGFRGMGPIHYYLMFDQVGLKYNPEALIIAIFTNDVASTSENISKALGRMRGETKYRILDLFEKFFPNVSASLKHTEIKPKKNNQKGPFMSMVEEANRKGISNEQILEWKESIPPNLMSASRRMQYNANVFRTGLLYPDFYLDSIDVSSDRAKKKWKNMTDILSEIIRKAEDHKVEVAIVYLPSCFHYDPVCLTDQNPRVLTGTRIRQGWLTETSNIQKLLAEWTENQDIPFLDLTPYMREEIELGRKLNYPLDGHWQKNGHQVAAQAIQQWLNTGDVFSFIGSQESSK